MPGPVKLDRIDLNILSHLQANGRMSNVELAQAVNLSPSPCLQRVKRLEAAGYIAGYGARIDLAKLRDTVTVFTEITLTDHRRDDFIRFEASIRTVEEALECHLVSGGYDYLVKFVAGSIGHYQRIIEGLLDRKIGIGKYFSYIVIKTLLERHAVPINRLDRP